jgi:hypothetical protein
LGPPDHLKNARMPINVDQYRCIEGRTIRSGTMPPVVYQTDIAGKSSFPEVYRAVHCGRSAWDSRRTAYLPTGRVEPPYAIFDTRTLRMIGRCRHAPFRTPTPVPRRTVLLFISTCMSHSSSVGCIEHGAGAPVPCPILNTPSTSSLEAPTLHMAATASVGLSQ